MGSPRENPSFEQHPGLHRNRTFKLAVGCSVEPMGRVLIYRACMFLEAISDNANGAEAACYSVRLIWTDQTKYCKRRTPSIGETIRCSYARREQNHYAYVRYRTMYLMSEGKYSSLGECSASEVQA
jgi:hypothetical protein